MLDGEIVFSRANVTGVGILNDAIQCIWILAAVGQNVTEVELTHIEVESENKCFDNSIQVRRTRCQFN